MGREPSRGGIAADIEILYFAGCPAYRRARENVLEALSQAGLPPQVKMVRVRHQRDADALGFRGSPTVRIDRADVDPEGLARGGGPGLYSRTFRYRGHEYDAPPVELLRERLASSRPA